MRILLPTEQSRKLVAALARAGPREIGGQLFGEQLAPSNFRITELTIQSRPGSYARFVVDLVQAARDALVFFARTSHQYARYNYVGEWHSHPSFAVQPSSTDATTMREMVTSADFRGHFAVLMIARLDGQQLVAGAWVFDPQRGEQPVCLEIENELS